MLVLSRTKGERIIIGTGPNAIVVTVVEIRAGKTRLGIEAPDNIPIHREEVYNEIHGQIPG